MEETLGERLKRLRIQEELTQEDVARYIYVTEQAVGMYENGSRQPTSDKLLRIASLFHVSVDYLLGIQDRLMIDVEGLTSKQSINRALNTIYCAKLSPGVYISTK